MNGVLYGATADGGNCGIYGCDTIYAVKPNGQYETIYLFPSDACAITHPGGF